MLSDLRQTNVERVHQRAGTVTLASAGRVLRDTMPCTQDGHQAAQAARRDCLRIERHVDSCRFTTNDVRFARNSTDYHIHATVSLISALLSARIVHRGFRVCPPCNCNRCYNPSRCRYLACCYIAGRVHHGMIHDCNCASSSVQLS